MTDDKDRRPSILLVVGPTASGKSRLAMALADALGGEIVSADSVQVYRGFDIGSAKPSLVERAMVPHHLVDIREPDATYNAGDFIRDAAAAIDGIVARGRMPIVCGGTGLYVRSLVHGLTDAAPADTAVRARLEAEAASHGLVGLHARLAAVDEVAAARIHGNDRIRIVRALELVELTGRGPTAWFAEHALSERPYRYAGVALTAPRAVLHRRIAERTRAMVGAGLVDEARALLAAGVSPGSQPFGAIGYREALQVIRGELDSSALVEVLSASTRQYAKRQLVWLRHQIEGLRWFDARNTDRMLPILTDALGRWWEGARFEAGAADESEISAVE